VFRKARLAIGRLVRTSCADRIIILSGIFEGVGRWWKSRVANVHRMQRRVACQPKVITSNKVNWNIIQESIILDEIFIDDESEISNALTNRLKKQIRDRITSKISLCYTANFYPQRRFTKKKCSISKSLVVTFSPITWHSLLNFAVPSQLYL